MRLAPDAIQRASHDITKEASKATGVLCQFSCCREDALPRTGTGTGTAIATATATGYCAASTATARCTGSTSCCSTTTGQVGLKTTAYHEVWH